MNTINLTGNICNDLELKQTASGKSVMNISIAVKRPYSKDATDFIPLVVWDQSAEYLSKYARKGSRIGVSGKLTTRKFEDANGNKRTAFEVVCDTVEVYAGDKSEGNGTTEKTYTPEAYATPHFEEVAPDDDLPF